MHPDRLAAPPDPLRILVVDDDPEYRSYVAAMTRRLGFAVEVAEDGLAAVDSIEHERFDVAVIDQQMPRLDGLGVVARIRDDEPNRWMYAVMLTARDDEPSKLAALNAGFDDFVSKAASEPELMAKLAAAKRIAARHRTLDVAVHELYGLATRDELTGMFNRRFLASETARYLADSVPLAVIILDLDGFKLVNDTHGHLVGDSVLREVAAILQRNTRPEDLLARYGGDEFVMVVPDLTPAEAAPIARRLADQVAAARWHVGESDLAITVSWGLAASDRRPTTVEELLNAADQDLYRSKRGRTAASVPMRAAAETPPAPPRRLEPPT